ncbi:DMT family transporter [Paraglaciecola arctica]|uniref:DMT family transporter n=1 Tax=Paraglaciecola arctica TaxID=1128911 RepID=UPI00339D7ADF
MSNLRSSLFMVLAMAAFALEDMFIKATAGLVPVGEILLFFGIGGTLAFIVMTLKRGQAVFHPKIISWPVIIRIFFEVIGRLFYTLAIVYTPLSSASAILQATPLVVVMGAALFLGERVSWQRWGAIAIGFTGVLVIIRPGLESFEISSLLAVIGMLGFAGRDLATRAASPVLSNLQLGIYGFFILIPTGLLMLLFNIGSAGNELTNQGFVWPDVLSTVLILAATIFGVIAYYWLTIAMRNGDVSVVTPFRYTRIVFALIIGATIFGERPDNLTLFGILIIVASGLYTLLHSKYSRSR